jgi:hypothetical protein
MISRENRVLLASTTLVALLVITIAVTGFSDGSGVLVLLLVAGVGVLGPQLYLAATDEDVAPRTRSVSMSSSPSCSRGDYTVLQPLQSARSLPPSEPCCSSHSLAMSS